MHVYIHLRYREKRSSLLNIKLYDMIIKILYIEGDRNMHNGIVSRILAVLIIGGIARLVHFLIKKIKGQ